MMLVRVDFCDLRGCDGAQCDRDDRPMSASPSQRERNVMLYRMMRIATYCPANRLNEDGFIHVDSRHRFGSSSMECSIVLERRRLHDPGHTFRGGDDDLGDCREKAT